MNEYFFTISSNWENRVKQMIPYLRQLDKPIIIFLSGPAGMGKSSVSIELCHLLGIRNYICTDILRIILASKEIERPLLQYFSHECWKYYGVYSEDNLVNGFRKQSEIICDSVDLILRDALRHKKNTIIEGIHLLPSLILKRKNIFSDLKMVFIYITADYNYFKDKLLPNRVVSTYRHLSLSDYDEERMSRFKIFQEMWQDELDRFGIKSIANSSSPEMLINKIFNQLISEMEGN